MNKNTLSPSLLRKRKMILLLPWMALPFLTLGFWALGGGQAGKLEKAAQAGDGLNVRLPGAQSGKETALDKMSYYNKAEADSVRVREQRANDPLFKLAYPNPIPQQEPYPELYRGETLPASPFPYRAGGNGNEAKLLGKLQQLNKMLASADPSDAGKDSNGEPGYLIDTKSSINPVDEKNVHHAVLPSREHQGVDPDLQQIDSMLDKILRIQHPEQDIQASNPGQGKDRHVLSVAPVVRGDGMTLLTGDTGLKDSMQSVNTINNEFYSLDDATDIMDKPGPCVEAVIDETQTITTGSTVKLRLSAELAFAGMVLPAGQMLYGECRLEGERLKITVSHLIYRQTLIPVSLSLYDLDGLMGLFVPGTVAQDAGRESSEKAIERIAINSLDPSIAGQAAGAGIEAAKTLLQKKVKRVRVTLKAGYRVLLKNNEPDK